MLRAALVLLLALAAAPAARAQDDAYRRDVEGRLAALSREPESARRLGEEARLLHFLAEATPGGDARDVLRERGLAAAERALALDRDEPLAILWWTAHRGSQATALRPLEAIRIASDIEKALLRLRDLAPDFDHAAADRVLGHVYRIAPAMISVGSLEKSRRHLREAVRRAPAYPGNLLALAQLLAQQGRCADARKGARVVLESPLLARHPLEAPAWRREARELADRPCG